MDHSEVKRIVDANAEALRDALWLNTWKIVVEYDRLDDDHAAECGLDNADYNLATITMDPAKFSTEKQVVQSLVHELLHITLCRFGLYRDAMIALIPEHVYSDGGGQVEQRLYRHAMEQAVEMLQRGVARHLWDASPQVEPEPLEGAALTE